MQVCPLFIRIPVFAVMICPPLVMACSRQEIPEGYPEPGKMHVVSVTPLVVRASTIYCDFSEWFPGSPLPRGFIAPNERFATVSRFVDPDSGRTMLRQTWLDTDNGKKLDESLRIAFDSMTPGETYTIEADCTQTAPGTVWVQVWEQLPDDSFTNAMLEGPLELNPATIGTPAQYTAKFSPATSSRALLATRGEKGAAVDWYNIRVVKSE